MMHGAAARVAIVSQLTLLVVACTPMGNTSGSSASNASGATALTPEQRAAGWRSLFDGTSTAAWRGYKQQTMPDGWKIVDGVLTKTGSVGDIITRDQFGNFELALDWKLSAGGNAGIFYRGTDDYALYPSPAGVVKPADQWNSTLIVVNGNSVQHWMNGQKLLEYELGSPDWQAKVKASKFVAYPKYGTAPRGYIGIQGDHDGTLSLRNIRIRVLP